MINKIAKVTKFGSMRKPMTKKQKAMRATMAKRKIENSPKLYVDEIKQQSQNYSLFANKLILADDLEKAREELRDNDTPSTKPKTYSKKKY